MSIFSLKKIVACLFFFSLFGLVAQEESTKYNHAELEEFLKPENLVEGRFLRKASQYILPVASAALGAGAVYTGLQRKPGLTIGLATLSLLLLVTSKRMHHYWKIKKQELYRKKMLSLLERWQDISSTVPEPFFSLFEKLYELKEKGLLIPDAITDEYVQAFVSSISSLPENLRSSQDINKLLFVISEIGIDQYSFAWNIVASIFYGVFLRVGEKESSIISHIATALINLPFATLEPFLISLVVTNILHTGGSRMKALFVQTSPEKTMLYSFFITQTVKTVLFWFFKEFGNDRNLVLTKVINFIQRWPYYKDMTPPELATLFDGLYEQYGSASSISYSEKLRIHALVRDRIRQVRDDQNDE